MKILRLPAYFLPEQMSSTPLQAARLEHFVEMGFEIEVYTPIPTRGVSKEVYKKYKRIKYEEMYGGKVKVHRFFMFREGKNALLRAFRYFFSEVIQYFACSRAEGVDIIFASSTPPIQGLLCITVKKKLERKMNRPIPLIYNLQDIFPDSLVNAGMAKRDGILWKIGRWVEDYTYKNSDKIIVISEDFKENILKKGVSEEKIEVIPNWADTDGIYNVSRKDNKIVKNQQLDCDSFYIVYCGNIGHSQNMDMLLEAAKEIEKMFSDIVFVIVGDGAAKEKMHNRIENERIENVIMLPFQPYEDIAHVFSLGDMGLIISKRGIGNNSVPSKTWGYMAAERPILCSFDEDSELCKIILEAKCGLIAEAGNKEALISQIEAAYNNKDALKDMGTNGLKYMEKYNDKATNVGRYVDVIKSCFGENDRL